MSEIQLYGTEVIGDEPALTLDQRLGRCYELAGYALTLGSAPPESTLVHGTIHGTIKPDMQRIGHACLILPSGWFWEPITGRVWFPTVWMTMSRLIVEARYNVEQARRYALATRTWGPWHPVVEKR